ncbi:uncharacterized protein PEZ65_006699 [Lycodopsis pacificus]
MDEDEELERGMLSISPSKQHVPSLSEAPLISPETSAEPAQLSPAQRDQSEPSPRPLAVPTRPPPQLPGYDHEVSQWTCSQQQRIWMKTELESMGLWPGSFPVRNLMKMVSLWRLPPQPELIDSISDLPSPKYFQLHPFFIWKPENDLMARLRNNYTLPCIEGCARPQVVSAGVGRPRVIVGLTGQYYLLSSRLCCKVCRKRWYADNPVWLDKLPKRFTNLLPAVLTYKKAICKSVMDELRRTGNSPTDMAKQIMEMMHLKFERAHLAYLLGCQNIMDAEAGKYDQRTITQFIRQETKPAPFGFPSSSRSDSHLRGVADGFVEMPAAFSYGVMSTPGAAAKDLRAEVLNAALDRTPDVFCVLAPSNNLTSSRTVVEAGVEFALLLSSVCEKWDEVVVVDFPPRLNVPVDVQEHLRNQYRVKAASAGVRYWSVAEQFPMNDLQLWYKDSVHLSDSDGMPILAKAFFSAAHDHLLRKVLDPVSTKMPDVSPKTRRISPKVVVKGEVRHVPRRPDPSEWTFSGCGKKERRMGLLQKAVSGKTVTEQQVDIPSVANIPVEPSETVAVNASKTS